jgi:hypothetical protein
MPAGTSALTGAQSREMPLHCDTLSHTSAALRQMTPGRSACVVRVSATRGTHARTWSAGHAALMPLQYSTASHALVPLAYTVDCRQITLDALRRLAGQNSDAPVQYSATSQAPAAARHAVARTRHTHAHKWCDVVCIVLVLTGASTSGGHSAALPVHVSARSHTPAYSRTLRSLGYTSTPAHMYTRTRTYTHTAGRHTRPAMRYSTGGHAAVAPSQYVSLAHGPSDALTRTL